MGTSSLTSGKWKQNAGLDIQAPATERTGQTAMASLNTTAPLLDSTKSNCWTLTRVFWSKRKKVENTYKIA